LEFSALGLLGSSLLLDQRVQHRQQEGRGLAAAGLARDHQVDEAGGFGAHGQRNGLFLHGGGLAEAEFFDGGHQLRGQAQAHETVGQLGCGRGVERLQHGRVGAGRGDEFGRRRLRGHEIALRFKSVGHEKLTFLHAKQGPWALAAWDG
jgi:hypothetical protein